MMNINNLRDCLEWRKQDLDLMSKSNEACKLYDASLRQYVGWFDSSQHNGLEATLNGMLNADSEFLLGYCLKYGIELIGNSAALSSDATAYKSKVTNLIQLAKLKRKSLSTRELAHINAIRNLASGELVKASDCWESILIESPNDIMALKFAHDVYFYTGQHAQMRDSVARVLPKCAPSMPMYSYLYGMISFGYAQTNFFGEAEQTAKRALEMNPFDGWATHTLCHVAEYKNNYENGIDLLSKSEHEWSVCGYIAPHNYWHWCLYYLECNQIDAAMKIYDQMVKKYLDDNSVLTMVDAVSFLFRLKLNGVSANELRERWLRLKQVFAKRFKDHGYLFNDLHILMLLSETGTDDELLGFFKSLDDYIILQQQGGGDDALIMDSFSVDDEQMNSEENKENCSVVGGVSGKATNNSKRIELDFSRKLNDQLARSVSESIFSFDKGDYDRVIELLYPIRYDLIRMGGSNAQRDLFHQMMCQSGLRSSQTRNKCIGLAMINERRALKPNSPLTSRIVSRFFNSNNLDDI